MKQIPEGNKGLAKLPKNVRNRMGYMSKGGVATFSTCKSCTSPANCTANKKCQNAGK